MHKERKLPAAVAALATAVFLVLLTRLWGTGSRHENASSPAPLFIEVRGEVRNPGLYALNRECLTASRILTAAGGFRDGPPVKISPDSSLQGLTSGQAVRFIRKDPGEPQMRIERMGAAAALALGGKLDLNRAAIEDLCLVPQMKPETADAIVRRRCGRPWRAVDELEEIQGVGRATAEKWKAHLEVEF